MCARRVAWLFAVLKEGAEKAMTVKLTHLHSDEDLAHALEHLAGSDSGMRDALAQCGVPPLRRRAPGFAGLAAIVTGQQLSTHAARSIWARLEDALGVVSAQAVGASDDAELAACGLSRPKIRTLRAIVEAVENGTLDFARLEGAQDEGVHAELTAIKGIGPWTADIFLLFCLGRADAWPAGDLALMEAIRLLRGHDERPRGEDCVGFADCWRPYRGAAAHLLWAYYAVAKGRSGVPDAAGR